MLDKVRVGTRLPTQHLARARRFYAEKLGLEPTEERPGGLLLRVASGGFALYARPGPRPRRSRRWRSRSTISTQ
jgi:catechol 2,3-dioxygenase-like lactoylglutathione lyase family enzyme